MLNKVANMFDILKLIHQHGCSSVIIDETLDKACDINYHALKKAIKDKDYQPNGHINVGLAKNHLEEVIKLKIQWEEYDGSY